MATYTLRQGNIVRDENINRDVVIPGEGGKSFSRITLMATLAVNGCPHNKAPTQYQVQGEWEETRGLRLVASHGQNTWEGNVPNGPYQLDLQGFTADQQYANWQIQYGHFQSGGGGTVAHVLLKVNHTFSLSQFIHALQHSAINAQTCLLEP